MKALLIIGLVSFSGLIVRVIGDAYLHHPRGSNNRNCERNANRNNANRMFDSQNNGKGGYPCPGDPYVRAAPDPVSYVSGTDIDVVWTHQHACNSDTTHCDLIIQYQCSNYEGGLRDGYATGAFENSPNNPAGGGPKYIEAQWQTNGNQDGTNTIPDNEVQSGCSGAQGENSMIKELTDGKVIHSNCNPCSLIDPTQTTGTGAINGVNSNSATGGCEFGMHETYYHYRQFCKRTSRNKGLFTADRNLNNNKGARATRQNPNGNRRGLECPEERDYYPYWNPSPWIDVAVLVSNEEWCPYYQAHSQNVEDKWFCQKPGTTNGDNGFGTNNNQQAPITEKQCVDAGGEWLRWKAWNKVDPQITAPNCTVPGPDAQNYLGYTFDGERPNFKWRLPNFDQPQQCVLRVRYNISTNDYKAMAGFGSLEDEFNEGRIVDSQFNCGQDALLENRIIADVNDVDASTGGPNGEAGGACVTKELSEEVRPLYNRPEVDVFPLTDERMYLSIALNTDQSGRTFQDRSYMFDIIPRNMVNQVYGGVDCEETDIIEYVAVQGKRGNIVQTYPATEYKFVQEEMVVAYGTCLLWVWDQSQFNTNRNPNNGEGWRYSDASNVVQNPANAINFPKAHVNAKDEYVEGFFTREEALVMANCNAKQLLEVEGKWSDAAAANAGLPKSQYICRREREVQDDDNDQRLCGKCNPVQGKVMMKTRTTKPGTYTFVATRNNNFSNRKQTLKIRVGANPDDGNLNIAGAVVGSIFGVAAAAFGILVLLAFIGVINIPFVTKCKKGMKGKQTHDELKYKASRETKGQLVEKKTQQV